MDEDCLYLNVWTPGPDDGRRPVLVWIHGGGNTVGSGAQPRIDGQHLARRGDVVVVTLNYRLGALGFLHVPELGGSGNEGLLDQLAALRWVRREIASFGGDPRNVTVFGQSAGGFDIAQLMGLRQAAGAFDRAVPMSGSLTPQIPAEQAARVSARFAEHFGGTNALRAVPAADLVEFLSELTAGPPGRVRVGPVLDGRVIGRDAAVGIGSGEHTRGLPLMIGHTRDEFALFTATNEALAGLDDARLLELARGVFRTQAERALDGYRAARAARGASTEPLAIWNAVMTDQTFRLPAIRTAELHSSHTPDTWVYRFDHPSPALEGRLGACHSLDIPFIWGTCETAANMRAFCGSGPAVEQLSETLMDTYLAFARAGDPNSPALPDWPRYETSRRATMHFGEKCLVEDAPLDDERALCTRLGQTPEP
jgi:para-nitrobenzyl esterase